MRASVFTDARLVKLAGRFAWLDLDTEKPVNFAFVERFPIEAWPTVYVIDPATEQVLLRWMGAATAPELSALLGDAERTFRKEQAGAAAEAAARGAASAAGRRHAEAAQAFSEALTAGGPAWSERARTADALVQALSLAGDPQACAGAAGELLPRLPHGSSFARVAGAGLGCALEIEPEGSREPAIRALEPQVRLALGQKGVLADDRLGLFGLLHQARQAQGDEPGARRAAREWLAFVEDQSRRTRDPLARSALDGGRLSAAMALGEPARALPALRASAAALPREYFAQSYVAVCALEAGLADEALAAARLAVPLAEGPRKVRIMTVEAQALKALGREPEALQALEAAILHGEGLPEAVRPKGHLARAKKLLAQWTPAPTPTLTPGPTPTPPR
ncbi:MAG: hypothetical protein IPO09_02980 [Anaeromyxobacter sp.]|nr:hypothetical protein [Anaeromyxobacter sp.]MBL0275547.1 hypothetical protein [Anaeromyxobacter sp.]